MMRARRIDFARWLPYASLLLAAAALAWVAHVLAAYSPRAILRGLEQLPARSFALALGFSAAAYGALTLFDYFGLRYCGRTLPYRRVALASFTALSIGHTVGLAPFSSGAVRYRYYTRWGLRRGEVGLVILFCAVTVALGETAVSAAALLLRPQTAADILKLGRTSVVGLGIGCLLLIAGFLALCASRRSLKIGRWRLKLPSWQLALGSLGAGLLNYSLVVGAFWSCLSPTVPIDYPTASIAFVLANLAALVSAVPGGLGVIEAVIVTLLPNSDAAVGVIAFRVTYFLVPFLLGVCLFAATELRLRMLRHFTPRVDSRAS
jgi:hypothetical protein